MAIPDGKPATDFSAMNREWVRAVAAEAAEAGGGGIPAPENPSDGDVLTYSSSDDEWVAAAPSGGGGVLVVTSTYDQLTEQTILSATAQQIITAAQSGPVIYMQTNILDADPPTEYSWQYLSAYYISEEEHEYPHTFYFSTDDVAYYANSLSDYPKNPGDPIPGE